MFLRFRYAIACLAVISLGLTLDRDIYSSGNTTLYSTLVSFIDLEVLTKELNSVNF